MAKNDKKLTSVKIDPELFEEFKTLSIKTKISFQKLCERSVYLYLTDTSFRSQIGNQFNTSLSGSK